MKWTSLLSLTLSFVLIVSCAPSLKHYPNINQHLINQDYDGAYKIVKDSKKTYAERNAVLYYLDEGIITHYGSRFDESNQSLSQCETMMEGLYTKSLSKAAASFVISDNTVPYRGEDFERAMVNLFMALNYVGLGDREDALVEARRVDNVLSVINSHYEEDAKNVYKEDGFIRFIMGTLYEADAEMNDAYISYKKAEEIYQNDYLPNYGVAPPSIVQQLCEWHMQLQTLWDYAVPIPRSITWKACWFGQDALGEDIQRQILYPATAFSGMTHKTV